MSIYERRTQRSAKTASVETPDVATRSVEISSDNDDGRRGNIQECEYSASSGLPFNAMGQEWTQLRKAKALMAAKPLTTNSETSYT